MEYLFTILFSIIIMSLLMFVLLVNSKNSSNIRLDGNILTILYPLKKDVIDLESELESWNVHRINRLWRGNLYTLNLELRSGKWKKVYSTSTGGKIGELIRTLEKYQTKDSEKS